MHIADDNLALSTELTCTTDRYPLSMSTSLAPLILEAPCAPSESFQHVTHHVRWWTRRPIYAATRACTSDWYSAIYAAYMYIIPETDTKSFKSYRLVTYTNTTRYTYRLLRML